MDPRRFFIIVFIVAVILSIPLIAMLFTEEVNWSMLDFSVAAALLFGTGFMLDLIIRKVKRKEARVTLSVVLIGIIILIWIELAVGIFNTPLVGH